MRPCVRACVRVWQESEISFAEWTCVVHKIKGCDHRKLSFIVGVRGRNKRRSRGSGVPMGGSSSKSAKKPPSPPPPVKVAAEPTPPRPSLSSAPGPIVGLKASVRELLPDNERGLQATSRSTIAIEEEPSVVEAVGRARKRKERSEELSGRQKLRMAFKKTSLTRVRSSTSNRVADSNLQEDAQQGSSDHISNRPMLSLLGSFSRGSGGASSKRVGTLSRMGSFSRGS